MNKIYCFLNSKVGGEGAAYAMAEDGVVLGSHWCSHEGYIPHDLGIEKGSRPDRHETYKKHYPNGYELEFVYASDVSIHVGLQETYRLNQLQREEEKK